MAAATRSSAAPPGHATAPVAPRSPTTAPARGRSWATATCTTPWTIAPDWPTPRSCPTRTRPPPRSSGATAWFRTQGIERIVRTLTDNGSCYRSGEFAATLAATDTEHKRTRPYRPQTNGKVERFNRTLLDEWAYAQPYPSETARRAALPDWLHYYNHYRGHTAIGGPPATRIPNLTGQNI